ncbi:MAG: hypothetical protein IPJ08_08385 [Burkholderiales bacterium]|nr:hypothetical protein [Burkholderiales bacterium]
MIAPMPVQDIHAGREAFQRDLQAVLKEGTLADRGWLKPDGLTLLVPMLVENAAQGQVDLYLLRLMFDHYPKGPPSAQFINPLTMNYKFPDDVLWVPKCENAPDVHFHPNYNNCVQLICSSTTLEFYRVNHDVKPEHVWDPQRMNFLTTLAAIRRGLASPYYKGRWTP